MSHYCLLIMAAIWVALIALNPVHGGERLVSPPAQPQAQEGKQSSRNTGTRNNRPNAPVPPSWGVFLGAGMSQETLSQIDQWQQEGKWINPLTGEPLQHVPVFVFGQDNPLVEGLRLITDHLQLHVLSSWEDLHGQQFDVVLCHSNGCTNAIDAYSQSRIQVGTFFALGTDWTARDFPPGALQDARLVFFVQKGDPIWKIPAPTWTHVNDGVGLQFSIPFDSPRDIPKGFWNLLTQGRADPDRFLVIRLAPPSGQQGTALQPLRAHALVDSYFSAMQQWLHNDGPQQEAVRKLLRHDRDDKKSPKQHNNAALPPSCPGCGGGPGGPPGPPEQGPGPATTLHPMSKDPRGGVAADIHLTPKDFQTR